MKRRHISLIAMALVLATAPAAAPAAEDVSAAQQRLPASNESASVEAQPEPLATSPSHASPPSPATPTPNAAEKTFTQKTLFSIPFYLNPRAKQPTEVRLFVSNDSGRNWLMYQQRQPHEGRFDFQASRDGEYWFIVRTNFDRDAPGEHTRPEKVVIVDRTAPLLTLQAEVGRDGEIVASWRATDANLEPRTLRIEYRTADDPVWQPVMLPQQTSANGSQSVTEFIDSVTWMTSATQGNVQVRAQVFDRSLNETNESAQLALGAASQTPSTARTLVDAPADWQSQGSPSVSSRSTAPPAPAAEHLTDPFVSRQQSSGLIAASVRNREPEPAKAETQSRPDALSTVSSSTARATSDAAATTRSASSQSTAVDAEPRSRWSSSSDGNWSDEATAAPSLLNSRSTDDAAAADDRSSTTPVRRWGAGTEDFPQDGKVEHKVEAPDKIDSIQDTFRDSSYGDRPAPDFDQAARDDASKRAWPRDLDLDSEPSPSSERSPESPLDSVPGDDVADVETPAEADANESMRAPIDATANPMEPPDNMLREPVWFNAKRFNLDYEVTDLQDSAVARVELWQTRDEGRSWTIFGQDKDLASPMVVENLDEGTYGFRLMVTNDRGKTPPVPQPGDEPELLVVVDRTKPVVHIDSAAVRSTSRGPLVHIRWSTRDDGELLAKPIEISYAPLPEGPWELICSELDNSGKYAWSPTITLPPKFYVKVDATDRAGNTGSATTSEPVGSAVGPPKAIIRRIQPVRTEVRGERQPAQTSLRDPNLPRKLP